MTREEKIQKYVEYYDDPVSLIEDCFKVHDNIRQAYSAFFLFPKQRELLYKYDTCKHVLCNKSRQAGITTVTAAYIAAKLAFATPEMPMNTIIIANKAAQAQEFLGTIAKFLAQIPRWIWGDYYDDSKEVDGHIEGKGSVKSIKLMNGTKLTAVATSKDAIRGASSPRFILVDEAAYLDKTSSAEEMISSALMALSSNKDGQMFMISTPNGNDPVFHATYLKSEAENRSNNFTIHEIYYFQDPRYNQDLKWEYKDENGDKYYIPEVEFDVNKMVETYKKGGIPISSWFLEQCASMNNNKLRINRELMSRFDGSGNTVVDDESISRHELRYVTEPMSMEGIDKNVWIWEFPKKDNQYVAAVDVSSGEGEDFSSLQIINVTTGEQALEYKGKIKSNIFADIIKTYCEMYNAVCEIDTTGGYGDNLISDLEGINFNLFVVVDDKKGFKLSISTRPRVFQRFVSYVEDDGIKIKSKRTTSELRTFIWKNGRPDHASGYNDDCICAMALAIWTIENHFKKLKNAEELNKAIVNVWAKKLDTDKKQMSTKKQTAFSANRRLYQNGVDITQHKWVLGLR